MIKHQESILIMAIVSNNDEFVDISLEVPENLDIEDNINSNNESFYDKIFKNKKIYYGLLITMFIIDISLLVVILFFGIACLDNKNLSMCPNHTTSVVIFVSSIGLICILVFCKILVRFLFFRRTYN